jgi:hypothetical protein
MIGLEDQRQVLTGAGRGKLPVVVATTFEYTGIGPGQKYGRFKYVDPCGKYQECNIPTYNGEHGNDNKECFLFVYRAFQVAMSEAQVERPAELLHQLSQFFQVYPK